MGYFFEGKLRMICFYIPIVLYVICYVYCVMCNVICITGAAHNGKLIVQISSGDEITRPLKLSTIDKVTATVQ